ncbi:MULTISPECIES: hypothetical protein [unclassified Psychrobacter]|uniref:hypothetical protein n=1 Tax=unclassified Psychrobacter TaxID=196806 RepID=UPI00078E394A|nr:MULTISPECIES: hypothetical protein [unclassified Psychrobacter]AMN49021.1 hypothetical protein AK823_03180 [Psychrobacter sp. P2G3]AMN66842.1 hypothetical protein AK825_03135 [Psychrobacter sp. P11G5]
MATNRSDGNNQAKVPVKNSGKPAKPNKPIAPIRQRLMLTWLVWLIYRLFGLPIFISALNPSSPDIIGGIAWQALWLVPAFILTPWVMRGRSPYALLVGSMFTLVYLGASGVVLFTRAYGSSSAEIAVYLIDFILLLTINVWLFILLKRLPSMNNVVKQPR